MEFRESETVELKREYVDDIRKEIIAMVNTSGGTIYIGVDDDGSAIGIAHPDSVIQQVTNSVRDTIIPDATMFLHYETIRIEEVQVVVIHAQRGTARPYYLKAKGMRPEGVFVRQGTSSVPASETAIRLMIKETDGDNYEDMRSLTQSLTFRTATEAFAQQNLELAEAQMKTLGIMDADGIYTNLGLLLSDQCPHILKAATFGGVDQQNFQDRREFTGSLLKQLEDAYAYLELRNQTHATFEGLKRTDREDYPDVALREALLNAIVHRDYAFSAGTLIGVYTNRIEFTSVGGLVHGILLEDVLMGISVCRNQKLANVFYRLKLIEAYGTGIRKIRDSYQGTQSKPEFFATNNAFKLILPNLTTGKAAEIIADSPEKAVLMLIQESGSITRANIESRLNLKSASANRLLRRMSEAGSIQIVGKGRNTRYELRK